jgi:hypothetical protein
MKILKLIAIFILTTTLFFCCGATKNKTLYKFQKKPSFKIDNAVVSEWVGGQPGVRGLKVAISLNTKSVKLDTLFFRNQKTTLKLVAKSNPATYVGILVTSKGINDYILDKDSTKEFGNSPKLITKNIPFNLNNNEAIVSYQSQDKTYYHKIKITKKEGN